ncbi:hypothetical protein QR680_003575 [Steinernema hermaphroditum]|uniref:Uncharacterized protein n=1 Tax=Steinernema hermaphroditum TaxID=289476 RepID=A0AA39HLV9_9BILA|nr:hypothetical protein QR680_003575 [Steinernema hermaphroditum]
MVERAAKNSSPFLPTGRAVQLPGGLREVQRLPGGSDEAVRTPSRRTQMESPTSCPPHEEERG